MHGQQIGVLRSSVFSPVSAQNALADDIPRKTARESRYRKASIQKCRCWERHPGERRESPSCHVVRRLAAKGSPSPQFSQASQIGTVTSGNVPNGQIVCVPMNSKSTLKPLKGAFVLTWYEAAPS